MPRNPSDKVSIEHADGRRYGTTVEGFNRVHTDQGFEIVGDETPAAFEVTGIPEPKAPRAGRRRNGPAKPAPKRKAAPAPEAASE